MDQQHTYLCKYYVSLHDHMDHCTDLFLSKINIVINLKSRCILLDGVVYSGDKKRQNITIVCVCRYLSLHQVWKGLVSFFILSFFSFAVSFIMVVVRHFPNVKRAIK